MKEAGPAYAEAPTDEVLDHVISGGAEPEAEATFQIRTEPRGLDEVPATFPEVEVLVPKNLKLHDLPEGGWLVEAYCNTGYLPFDPDREEVLKRYRAENDLGQISCGVRAYVDEAYLKSDNFLEYVHSQLILMHENGFEDWDIGKFGIFNKLPEDFLESKDSKKIWIDLVDKLDAEQKKNLMFGFLKNSLQSFVQDYSYKKVRVHGLMGNRHSFEGENGWGRTEPLGSFESLDLDEHTVDLAALEARVMHNAVIFTLDTNGFGESGRNHKSRTRAAMRSTLAIAHQIVGFMQIAGLIKKPETQEKSGFRGAYVNEIAGHSMGGAAALLAHKLNNRLIEEFENPERGVDNSVKSVSFSWNPALISKTQAFLFKALAAGGALGPLANIFAPLFLRGLLQGTPKALRDLVYLKSFRTLGDIRDAFIYSSLGLSLERYRQFPPNSLLGIHGIAFTSTHGGREGDRLVPKDPMKELLELAGYQGVILGISGDHIGFMRHENIYITIAVSRMISTLGAYFFREENAEQIRKILEYLSRLFETKGFQSVSSETVMEALQSENYEQFLYQLMLLSNPKRQYDKIEYIAINRRTSQTASAHNNQKLPHNKNLQGSKDARPVGENSKWEGRFTLDSSKTKEQLMKTIIETIINAQEILSQEAFYERIGLLDVFGTSELLRLSRMTATEIWEELLKKPLELEVLVEVSQAVDQEVENP